MHDEGSCKRCCFFPRNRCTNGQDCEFCHYEHEKRTSSKRKSKSGRAQPDIEVELDDGSEEWSKGAGLEIQLPLSPASGAGDAIYTSWVNTPEGAPLFVQSCLYTLPAETKENTTAVPVYTKTLWGEEQNPVAVHSWNQQRGEYIAADGESYQIPRDWALHPQVCPRDHQFLPQSGSIVLPETAPLGVHQWQDMMGVDHWQEQDCTWPVLEAGWEFSQSTEQQTWDWGSQVEESYLGPWTECPLADDPAMAASMCWNSQQAEPHMPDYMPSLGEQADSHMPEYMPAIQCLPLGVSPVEDIEPPPLAPSANSSPIKAGAQPLPPGVELAVDLEPPPMAPISPEK